MYYKGTKCTYNSIKFESIPEKDLYIKLINDKDVSKLQVHPYP